MGNCKGCRWWLNLVSNRGECRRFPPTTARVSQLQGWETAFPEPRAYDWCGEFSPTPQETGR